MGDLPSLSLELDRSDLHRILLLVILLPNWFKQFFFDLSDLGLTSLSHPDILFFSYFKFVSRWRDSCAIFPLQRNGENRGGVEMVSFGLQNGEKQSSPSSSGSQIGEQQSSYSSSSGVVARVSFKHPSLSDAFGLANWGTALEYFEVLC